MAIPPSDLDRIRQWCREQWPEEMRKEVRLEADATPRHVDIVEVRPPWNGIGAETRSPIARLRYTGTTAQWSIYWCDRNGRFHLYEYTRPTTRVQHLLEYLADSGDPIFFG
ncbi:DUF3024 domain-containing protein [Microcella flavibacter]|uniref:DUF3024 domain-containing protein n=1 Tax=Microcella flavibacter TaxID=1804990 RepID=UPI0014570936|nr:DUF3024 domain-containing protein [Microcella flavibacter]